MFSFAFPLPYVRRRRHLRLLKAAGIPTVAEVEAAAELHEQGRQQYNAGSRLKRKALKVLDRAPDGQHGTVTVERVTMPGREVVDLDAIEAIFKARKLGPLPMKQCAPTLTLTWTTDK